MELALKPGELGVCACLKEETVRQNVEEDVSLPDYCSPIRRILKCVVQPNVSGVTRVGAQVSVSGDVVIRLIYVNENNTIDSCEESVSLAAHTELQDLPEQAVVTAAAAAEYVNCRATGQRKFSVSAAVSVRFCAFVRRTESFVAAVESCGCEAKTEQLSCLNLHAISEKLFDLSETIALPSRSASIGALLQADAALKITNQKAVSEKLLLQGTLFVDLLYCENTPERAVAHLTHTMPVSQVLDAPGAAENGVCDVGLTVCALQTMVRADGLGENRLLEIAAKVHAFIKTYGPAEQAVILDCYATDGAVTPTFATLPFPAYSKEIERRIAVEKAVALGAVTAAAVSDVHFLHAQADVRFADGTLTTQATLLFRLLLKDNDGQFQYLERSVEVSAEEAVDGDGVFTPTVCAENVRAAVVDGAVRLSFDCVIAGRFFCLRNRRVCVKIEEDSAAVPEEKSALTLCFAQKGQTLWEIAKKYRTTCALIQEENGLQADVLEEDRMLLVPSA